MLRWALIFLALAVLTGVMGFVVLVGVLAGIAKLMFLGFLLLVIISFVMRATHSDAEEAEEHDNV